MSKNVENTLIYTSKFFLFLVPVAFLLTFSDLIFPYIVSKHLVFRILVTLSFAFYIPLLFRSSRYGLKLSYLVILVLAFYSSFFIADLYAVYPKLAFWGNAERMEGFVSFVYLMMYFILLILHLRDKESWLYFMRAYMLVSTCIMMYSFWDWLFSSTNVRLSTFFGNPIYLAGFANFHIAFAMLLTRLSEHKLEKFAVLITVPVAFLVMLATATRGAILAFAFALVAAVLLYLIKLKNTTLKYLVTTSFIAIILLFSSLLVFKDSNFVRHLPGIQRFESLSFQKGTLFSRLVLWQIAERAILDNPFGWGQEGFNYVFNAYYDPRLWNHEEWFDRVHNTPLDILIQGGVLSFAIYLLLLSYVLYILYFKVEDPKETFILTFAFASYFISSLSVFDNLASYIPLLVLLAYLSSFDKTIVNLFARDDRKKFEQRRSGLSLLLSLAFLLLSTQYIYGTYMASKATAKIYSVAQYKNLLTKIKKIPNATLSAKIKKIKDKAEYLFSNYEDVLFDASDNPTLHKEYVIAMTRRSTLLNSMQNFYLSDYSKKYYLGLVQDLIAKELQKPYPDFMLMKNIVEWLNMTGEKDKAEEIYVELINKAPKKVQLYEALALTYISNKKYKEALGVINKALNLNPKNDRAIKIKQAILKALSNN